MPTEFQSESKGGEIDLPELTRIYKEIIWLLYNLVMDVVRHK